MLPSQPMKVHFIFHSESTMIEQKTISRLSKIANNFQGLIYAFIGGSSNTSLRTKNSDLDFILVWPELPTLQKRNEILNLIQRTIQSTVEWNFLDQDSEILRDAIKLQNFQKIEIYHHTFTAFEYLLQHCFHHDGLIFSLTNRIPISSKSEIERFIDSYIPDTEEERKSLYFSIMQNKELHQLDKNTIEDIIKLFSIYAYKAVPARKHWDKVIKEIPNYNLLLNGLLAEWLAQSNELLMAWAGTMPQKLISSTDSYSLIKYNPEIEMHVFEKVQGQKERLQTYLAWPRHIQSIDDQRDFSKRAEKQWREGKAYHFQILQDGHFAGAISIHSLDYQNRSFEFGYWMTEEFEGKGLLNRGLKLLISSMLEKGWNKPRIKTSKDNIKSIRVAERLGMIIISQTDLHITYEMPNP